MADNEATVVFKGDTTQLVGAVKKVGDAVNDSANKTISDFEKSLEKLARGVVIAKAIGDTLKAAAEEYNKIISDRKDIRESGIKSRVGITQNARQLGLSATAVVNQIETSSGSTNESERSGFLESLKADSGTDVNMKALGLFNRGVFKADRIQEAIANGTIDELIRSESAEKARLGPDFKVLTDARDRERFQNIQKFQTVSDQELGQSQSERQAELTRLGHPKTAAVGEGIAVGIGKVPFFGGLLEAGNRGLKSLGSWAVGGSANEVQAVRMVDKRLNVPKTGDQ